MRIITANEYGELLASAEILEKDARGLKVLRLHDGRILKIFRPRRRLWLARFFPAARRFALNGQALASKGVLVPYISEAFWIDKFFAISGCVYDPLPGRPLIDVFNESKDDFFDLLPALIDFVNGLHVRGVYFRSLHLGNIILAPSGHFGLIDFLDLRIKSFPLPTGLRKRNLKHMKEYLKRSGIVDFPWGEFEKGFLF